MLFHPAGLPVPGGLAAVLTGGLILALVRDVDRVNRALARFLESVKYQDYSRNLGAETRDESFAALHAAMNAILDDLRNLRTEKEEQAHYLQTIVQHVGIGLLVFQPDGQVELINAAAKRLLQVPVLRNLSSLAGKNPELAETLVRMTPKEKAFFRSEAENVSLVLYATEFRMRGRHFKLVSITNIQRELEEKEMEARQKLIRIITHEIMNSITPITSLAATVSDLLDEAGGASATPEKRDEIHHEIRVIDNGPGIEAAFLDRIFIPFFSTREGGSGIGLSLSREIMRRHRGVIRVQSDPGIKTTFTLAF